MRAVKYYKCPCCTMKYKSLTPWATHVRTHHPDWIVPNFSDSRLFYYAQTGRTTGSCVVCKKPTEWNEETGKYNRFCNDPKCKEKYRDTFKKKMIDKYGRVHLLNDPEQQRKMLQNRKISGYVEFKDGNRSYVGSYEKDFLEFCRNRIGLKAKDIEAPSPHTYTYKFDGKDHFYIPDFFIPDLNLEVEIKTHKTTHPKFVAVDFKKEAAKTEMMRSLKDINYVVIPDKDYSEFLSLYEKLKGEIREEDIPKTTEQKNLIINQFATESYRRDQRAVRSVMESFMSRFMGDKDRSVADSLYFVSEADMDGKVLSPRIPKNFFTENGYENNTTPRVCFSPTVRQSLMGVNCSKPGKRYFVYSPENVNAIKDSLTKPGTNEVPDSNITDEIWCLTKVKIKKIGIIETTKSIDTPFEFTYGDKTAELYEWKFKWIEKPRK